jgi:hypothetical protein
MTSENNEKTTDTNEENTSDSAHDNHGHEKPSYDDINTTAIIIVGLISALFTFLIIAFVQGLYYQWNNSYVRERSTDYVNKPVLTVINNQKGMLEGDEEAGTISIEKAMEKVLAKYGSEEH